MENIDIHPSFLRLPFTCIEKTNWKFAALQSMHTHARKYHLEQVGTVSRSKTVIHDPLENKIFLKITQM